ncbi:hypothetical protein RSAG8_05541, partial [Rhizoctonia solani AG-8 WAC10335]
MRIVLGLFLSATTLSLTTFEDALHRSITLSLGNSNMPPRRAKKPVNAQPSSSDSEPEVPSKSLGK